MKKTKIVATIGPASANEKTLESMIKAGLNVARFNMSHGTHAEHQEKIDMVKKVSQKLNSNVSLMLDTKGPEIRLGTFETNSVYLSRGDRFTIYIKEIIGDISKATMTYKRLDKDVKKGDKILLNDGLVMLKVINVSSGKIECEIMNSGEVGTKKGVNIPNVKLKLPFLTEQDKSDILFGVENNIQYVAASFVRNKEDMLTLRKYLNEIHGERVKIIAKIENQEGINNFDEILDVADGIMIARGDMGVEVDIQELPVLQKQMIKKCIAMDKPVITATQMLESMVSNPRPTRAEISDVANSIYDGTSCIMLSGETASGMYPIECVEMMSKIATRTEQDIDYWKRFTQKNILRDNEQNHLKSKINEKMFRKQINFAVCTSAMYTDAKAIISVSDLGKTPSVLSAYRPRCPIYVFTSNRQTYAQMSLEWGIEALYFENKSFDELLKLGMDCLLKDKKIAHGDVVILGGGTTQTEEAEGYLASQTMGAVLRV